MRLSLLTLTLNLLWTSFVPARALEGVWQLEVAGQTVMEGKDGVFSISNVTAPDFFGIDGSGSQPDFLSDDFIRLTGHRVLNGKTRYVWSKPFQIANAKDFDVRGEDLTFSDTPLVKPEFIRLAAPKTLLATVGQTVQITTVAIFPDNTADPNDNPTEDVSTREKFTVYRSSNAAVLTVGKDGLATARGNGTAFVTAVNSMVSGALEITVNNTYPTIVEGIVRNPDQGPVVGVSVKIGTLATTTDATGRFQLANVPSLSGGTLQVVVGDGSTETRVAAIPGGISDAGIIILGVDSTTINEYIVLFETNFDATTDNFPLPGDPPGKEAVLELVTISQESADGTIESPTLPNPITFHIPQVPSSFPSPLPTAIGPHLPLNLMIGSSDVVENKGILVSSNKPFQLFGLSSKQYGQFYGGYQPGSSEGYAAIPVSSLGRQYRVMSFPTQSKPVGIHASEFAVAGSQNGTTVTITPSVPTANHLAGVPYSIHLERLQTYQLRAEQVGTDLTGTLIVADKPVAVFAGHECAEPSTAPPPSPNILPEGCNHLIEQMPAIDTWGTSYIATPLSVATNADELKENFVRILANEDNTAIQVRGGVSIDASLNAGQTRDFRVRGVQLITSTKPILVAQYTPGQFGDGGAVMTMITPTKEFVTSYSIPVSNFAFPVAFVDVVAKTIDVQAGTLLRNGLPVSSETFKPIPNTDYSVGWEVMFDSVNNFSASQPFGLYIYEQGYFNGFAYPALTGWHRNER